MNKGTHKLKKGQSTRNSRHTLAVGVCFEPLEPRLLLSGSWGAGMEASPADSLSNAHVGGGQETVALHADAGISDLQALQQQRLQVMGRIDLLANAPALNATPTGEATGDAESRTTTDEPSSPVDVVKSRELVFVDAGVQNHMQLVDDILTNADAERVFEVIVLDADQDGIAQISDILADRSDLTAVHFITHGADGQINLGNARLNSQSLALQSEAVSGWGDALTENGDFLFYGCDIAAGSTGQGLLNDISRLTGADVTASDDATGHALLGGDWVLEQAVGEIETNQAVSADVQDRWASVLGTTDPLMVTTVGDVSTGGQPGTEDWNDGNLLQFADPNLAFAPAATDGTFSTAFDMDLFRSGAPVNAVHYVTADIQLGTSDFQLLAGDLLLSGTDGIITGNSLSLTDPHFSNSLGVHREDVFVFRPDTAGDYSVGAFALLLESPAGTQIWGVSLIEKETVVGDVTLEAGDFLFSRKGGAEDNDIWLFHTDDVGLANTSGSAVVLIEGDDPGVGIDEKIYGLDLVESTTTIGGRTLAAGTILVAVEKAEGVGPGDALAVSEFDIFALEVTQTTLGAGTGNALVSASLFFNGGDVAFDDDGTEALDGFTLTTAHQQAPVVTLPSPAISYVIGGTTEIDSAATVSDADSANLDGGTLTVSFSSGGTANDNLSILPNGTVTLAGFDVQVSAVTIGTYSGGTNGADLVIAWNASSSPADIQTVLRQIAYTNSVGADTSTRTLDFSLSDGDGATSAPAQQSINFTTNIAPVLTLPSSPNTYTENGPPVIVDAGAIVTDADSSDLNGGTLTVSIITNRDSNDLLSVVAGGNVTLSASDVLVSGTVIGTIDAVDDGTAGKDLVVAWNINSTPAAVQEVLRQIAFNNSSQDPHDLTRTLRITLTDGDTGTSLPATQQVIVHSVNDQPSGTDKTVSTAEETDYVFTAADFGFSDPTEGDAFNAVKITSLPVLGTLTNNSVAVALDDLISVSDIDAGLLIYTPPVDGTGSPYASFDFQVQDSGGTAHGGVNLSVTNTMTMNVTEVDDDVPTVVNQSMTVAEGTTNVVLTTSDLSSTDTDTDDTTLIYTVGNVSNGTLTINGGAWAAGTNDSFTQQDIIDGNVLYSHDGTNTTSDGFSYSVEDPTGNTLAAQTFSITVTAVDDDTPTAVNQSLTVAEGDTNVALTLTDLQSTDADTTDTTLIYTVGNVTNGTLTINGSAWAAGTNDSFTQQDIIDGNVLYTHDGSNTTSDSFSYSVEDPTGNTLAAQTFSITITPQNDAPVAVADSFTVNEGSATNFNLAANDSDGDDGLDLTSIAIATGPANGAIVVNADGTVDYTHDGSETISDSFTYTINDLAGSTSNTVTVNLTITPVNDTGIVTIDTPTPVLGDMLTASVSDADGASGAVSYQWYRDGAAITGANAASYTTVQDDVGAVITVSANYTDDLLTVENLTSAGTAAVINLNNAGTGSNDTTPPPADAPVVGNPSENSEPAPPEVDTAAEESEAAPEPEAALLEGVPEAADTEPAEEVVSRGRGMTASRMAFLVQARQPSSQTRAAGVTADNAMERPSSKTVKREWTDSAGPDSKRGEELVRAHNLMAARAYLNMFNSLDDVKKEVAGEIAFNQTVLGSAIAVSTGLSVGYVIWLVRGGMLLSSLLSSIPAWQILDPLPVLAGRKAEDDADDDESLASIIERKPQEEEAKKKPTGSSSDTKQKNSKR